ncbi:MAG TPA: choice-of-anchor tandem repeat NxxGxxAF-containing protein [Phycisphaerales bacterium]|nr:choice-of-anchor tandem repeat NxxGxxAF-containing protein [Phycisphaerales bacterium]
MYPMLPLASCLVALAMQDRGRPAYEIVAYTGQPTPIGGYFGLSPVPGEMNGAGEVSLYSDLHDPQGQVWLQSSIWRWSGGELSVVVKEDDPAPRFNQAWFDGVAPFPDLADDGRLGFHATLYGPFIGSNPNTLWVGPAPDQSVVIWQGTPVSGLEGVHFGGLLRQLRFGPAPSFAFSTDLTGQGVDSTNDIAAFVHDGLDARLLVREGADLSADLPGVAPYDWRDGTPHIHFDGSGAAYFSVRLAGPNVHPEDDMALVRGAPGDLTVIARRGDPAPGMGDGVNYGIIGEPDVNASGTIAFKSDLNLEGFTYKAGEVLWLGAPGGFQPIMRDQESLPGGYTAYGLSSPWLNEAGDVAFIARIDDDRSGPWAAVVRRAGIMRVVAASGAPAPDTEEGTVFGDEQAIQFIHLAETGQVAFVAGVEGPNVPAGAQGALWATDRDGQLRLVARTGDTLELDALRTIEALFLLHPDEAGDTRSGAFNEENQLAFVAQLNGDVQAVLLADLGDPCRVDFNDDGAVNTLDFLAYLNAFVAQDGSADFDGDGSINTLDFLFFLNEWALGCP